MSARFSLIIVGVLSIGLGGCGKEDTPSTSVSAPAAASSSKAEAKPAMSPQIKEERVVTYRPVNAKRRLSGEGIVILVPDDVEIESGRMLEYEVGADGKYYLRSVIPN